MSAPAIEFLVLVEAGVLEQQAVLLCDSARRFVGPDSIVKLTVISPRPARRPSPATIRALDTMDARYFPIELVSPCPDYGPSFKLLAAAWLEEREGPEVLIQIDSDTIFLGEPNFTLGDDDFLARPVDIGSICTTGADSPFDPFWRAVCEIAGADYQDLPHVQTTVDRVQVRANYNGGLLAARRSAGLFQQTKQTFLAMMRAGLQPFAVLDHQVRSGTGMVSREGSTYWGTTQAAFAVAAAALGARGRMLPATYNVPLHLFDQLEPLSAPPIHVHYHWLGTATAAEGNPLLDGRLKLAPEVSRWLQSRLPLAPVQLEAAR